MKNSELYHRTVDILVQAYFNDTIRHGSCKECAVGNIVTASTKHRTKGDWSNVFFTSSRGGYKQNIFPELYCGTSKIEIDATGYSWQDLAKIEFAFETAERGKTEEEWMFNGLIAVIDVLDQIHENKDGEATCKTKQRFQKI